MHLKSYLLYIKFISKNSKDSVGKKNLFETKNCAPLCLIIRTKS